MLGCVGPVREYYQSDGVLVVYNLFSRVFDVWCCIVQWCLTSYHLFVRVWFARGWLVVQLHPHELFIEVVMRACGLGWHRKSVHREVEVELVC